MILVASRGQAFTEPFTFKNEKGQELPVPHGEYRLTLERDGFVQEFSNLRTARTAVVWSMTADEVDALRFSTLYFALTFNGEEITRGVLRVK